MVTITVVNRDGSENTVTGAEGRSLMEVIRDNGIEDMLALCGGCCSCATCHVYVASASMDRLPPMSDEEDDLLESSDYRLEGSRLACQLPISSAMEGLIVRIAPEE